MACSPLTIIPSLLNGKYMFQENELQTYELNFPQVSSECPEYKISGINKYYQEQIDEILEETITELFPAAVESFQYSKKNSYPFFAYETIMKYNITYNDNDLLSLYYDIYTFTGGAHGTTVRKADTWNLKSGKQMELEEFYPKNEDYKKDLISIILMQIKEQIQTKEVDYFDNYEEGVKTNFDDDNFYLTDKGIVIFYQQYDIAPYSSGIREFLIPFRQVK